MTCIIRLLAAAILYAGLCVHCAEPTNDVRRALACVLPPQGQVQRFLQPSERTAVEVRAVEGGIPEVSHSGPGEHMVTVVLYGTHLTKAVIRTAFIGSNGEIEIDPLPYFLEKSKRRWQVTDGEGGVGTFERVARFVASLDKKPMCRIAITTSANEEPCHSSRYGAGRGVQP